MKAAMIRAINLSYLTVTLPLIMFIVFSVYINVKPPDEELTTQKIFTTYSLLAFARLTSLHFIVVGTLFLIEARVAFKRIKVIFLVKV